MTRRYPLLASPAELASYIALEGSVTPEGQCIEDAAIHASLRFDSIPTPNTDLSWGWVLGFVLAYVIAGFPIFTPSLIFLLASLVASVGLLSAAIQLRPLVAALNTRHSVSWNGLFVTTKDELLHVPLIAESYEQSLDQLRHNREHESEDQGPDQVSPVRSEATALATVGFGSMVDKPGQLWALDSLGGLSGLSAGMRGRLFRRRRHAFQWLARNILPDVFIQAASLMVVTVAWALALAFDGTQGGWGVVLPRLAQFGVALAVGRSVSSAWHTFAWWRVTRQDWARLALEERLVVAGVAGVPGPVVGELSRKGRPIGRIFVTPEEYARQRKWRSASSVGSNAFP